MNEMGAVVYLRRRRAMGRKLALLQDDPCSVNEAAKIVRTFDVW